MTPYDFAKELEKFSQAQMMALRQAKEKDDKMAKEFSVKDIRTLLDKTKRNLSEACKLQEHTISIQRNVTDYD